MKRIHLILTGLTISIVLLSINRLTNLTQSYLQPFEFLRWLDFNAMLPIPLLSVLLYYLLKREVVYDSPFLKTSRYVLLMILLISGFYFFAAGSGDHEVTNYMNFRFCEEGATHSPICNIIKYNDDEFSHYVYYVGFVLMNVALMLIEYNFPRKQNASAKDLTYIGLNSLLIAMGIFANLAFEETGLDLFFFGTVMLLSIYLILQKSYKKLPVTFYFALSYSVGVVSTLIYKIISA